MKRKPDKMSFGAKIMVKLMQCDIIEKYYLITSTYHNPDVVSNLVWECEVQL